jgi:Domain of unknown function (DUF5916)/Carbohydrate family 9 binding domain-like
MLAIILAAAIAAAPVEVRKTEGPIRIDAQLDEPAWASAVAVPVGYEWYPGDNIPAPVETEALVTYDERNLYVAFRAKDPKPELIRARHHERDGGGEDDDVVGFYVDPFNDDKLAYQFRVNPLGVQIDAINSDVEGSEDFSWDAIWDSAGRLTPDGYVVEIAVPLQQLRVPSLAGPQTWGFLAVREWPRDVAHRLRSVETDQNRDCLVCQFQDVRGVETRTSGRGVEVTPTLTSTDDKAFDAGVSARWAITPGTSLQATLNPDFSQVEADAAQLDVNTRFALFFPERRPFFSEGADYFETRLPLVFTRTIADPAAGAKLTGKSGSHLYGALFARDEITNLLVPGDEESFVVTLPGNSTSAFARYRKELSKRATVGGMLTTRRGEQYENTVLAADSFYRITDNHSVRVQLAGSRTSYPGAFAEDFGQPQGPFDGHALTASYNHADPHWTWYAQYNELSPEFRADSGFVNQVGVRFGEAGIERRLRGGPERWYRNIYLSVGADSTREYNGEWAEWGLDLSAVYEGPRQSEVSINLAPNQEYFGDTTYRNNRASIFGSMQLSRDVSAGIGIRGGEAIDFNNKQQAQFVEITPEATVNFGRHVSAELAYAYQAFETTSGGRIFAVHLPQARLLWHFNRRSYVRTILQYQQVEFPGSEERELLTQLLFSYRVNAQTVFLAGYSDDYQGERDLTRTERAVFVKLGYAFLF